MQDDRVSQMCLFLAVVALLSFILIQLPLIFLSPIYRNLRRECVIGDFAYSATEGCKK